MVLIDILISCETENVDMLSFPGDNYEWHFSVSCTKCQKVNDNEIYFKGSDNLDMPESKGKCNFVMRCKQCKNQMTIQFVEAKSNKNSIPIQTKLQNVVLATFECRGVELLTWNCQGLTIKAKNSGTIFEDVDLTDTWVDYDENQGVNCLVDKFKCQFQKAKKQ